MVWVPAAGGGREAERHRLIEGYLPLAHKLARRISPAYERHEDLVQVASLAVVRAVDRRDPARAVEFPSYVVRCVEGELLRHLRDRCSVLRPPRSHPSPAAPSALGEDDAADGSPPVEEVSLDRALVARAARALDARERRIVLERFYLERTQAEVAESLGLSQAHVSRLLDTALTKMRRRLARDEALFRAQRAATLGSDELEPSGGARSVAQRPVALADAEDAPCRAGGPLGQGGRQPQSIHRLCARPRGL
jgi:RNA polymerase sigma-B factor